MKAIDIPRTNEVKVDHLTQHGMETPATIKHLNLISVSWGLLGPQRSLTVDIFLSVGYICC